MRHRSSVLVDWKSDTGLKYCSISIPLVPCDMINTDARILGGPEHQTNSPPTRSTVSANLSLIINVILSRYQSTG